MTGPTEPAADLRKMASMLYQMYVALTAEGFSRSEALSIVSDVVRASISAGQKPDS